jgi:hypothetical protein
VNVATERVLKALRREGPDRIPTYEWFWPEFMEEWHRTKGEGRDIYDEYGIDVVSVGPDISPNPSLFKVIRKTGTQTIFRNGWGVVCRKVRGAAMLDFLEFPIKDEEDFASYQFVDPTLPTRYRAPWVDDLSLMPAEPFDARARELGRKHFVLGSVLDPYECLWRLRGVEAIMMDFYDRPDFVDQMVVSATDFMIELGIRQIEVGRVPGIFILGDVAYRNGLMFSPLLYSDKILPALVRMCSAFKRRGAHVFYHTDGNCTDLIEFFIEAGVEVLNPIETAAGMDLHALEAKYGGRICYMGGLDKRRFIDLEDLEEEVRAKCRGFNGGGLIACVDHSVGPDIPIGHYEHYVSLVHSLSREEAES